MIYNMKNRLVTRGSIRCGRILINTVSSTLGRPHLPFNDFRKPDPFKFALKRLKFSRSCPNNTQGIILMNAKKENPKRLENVMILQLSTLQALFL